jgi:hypothetical protein
MDNSAAVIATLDQYAAACAVRFVNAARSPPYNLPVVVTSGRRNEQQQRQLVQAGRSQTLQSKHLRGLAFDVDLFRYGRDAVPRWVWDELGPLGESFGLQWGGRWKSFVDVGHFEI